MTGQQMESAANPWLLGRKQDIDALAALPSSTAVPGLNPEALHELRQQAELQLTREPRDLPTLWMNPEKTDLFGWTYEDFRIDNYNPHPHIKAAVAV
jgi:hypothetical protein